MLFNFIMICFICAHWMNFFVLFVVKRFVHKKMLILIFSFFAFFSLVALFMFRTFGTLQ